MPSEKFHPTYLDQDFEGNDRPIPMLEVAWSSTGEYDKVYVQALRPDADNPLNYYETMAFDLDRKGINRMIRALRRARNAAFGEDE